ncbi:hypothetical protein COU76_03910 [Candidatus Peregrinibacteria bacterium CG10_big_fil_rev_8_21_14_0_10_49_10]|nr:MAG: hypothetical protein COU76_03910 [Candidatus Peregrinibacteria bacterium CG10_big_fil_rev_8_21_14_0_10_49_10]
MKKQSYARLLPRAFKKFGIWSARKTLLPTLRFYTSGNTLYRSTKPALFTMNILPPLMTVWHHIVRKHLKDKVDVVIFDSSGLLEPGEFPQAQVQKFINVYAATKSEIFLKSIAKTRRIAWICDDDMFPVSGKMVDVLHEQFAEKKTAAVSFRPREWWHLEIEGESYEPISSYCTAFNREILERENLSLKPAHHNNHPSHIGKPPGRYDTSDKANEQLIRRGYRCYIVPEKERKEYLTGFSGVSGAVMLLYYFKNPEQVLSYYENAPAENWGGNMLHGTLSSMLSICMVQELYTALRGSPYPLPSLPTRAEIEKLIQDHRSDMRPDQRKHEEMIRDAEKRLKKSM